MRRKKGFTLIELLAVIVVLAIIALIATPIVMGIIKNAKYSSLKRSSSNYANYAETVIIQEKFKEKLRIEDGSYPVIDNGNICIGKKMVVNV